MVLHAAAHGFHDGELQNPLRDILDVHQLMSEFSERDSGFAESVWSAASHLGLERPLHYALRYAARYFGAPAPRRPQGEAQPAMEHAMDACVDRAVGSRLELQAGPGARMALSLLYLRSHWLRMPPGLLARHLGTKVLRRREAQPRPGLTARA